MHHVHLTRVQKLLASATVVTLAGALAAVGTSSTWSTTQGVDQAVAAGTFGISLDGTGAATLTNAVSNLAPGDTATRLITVTNNASIPIAATTLSLTGSESALLDGTANGLQVALAECSTPWVDADTTDPAQQANPLGIVAGKYCNDPTSAAQSEVPGSSNGNYEWGVGYGSSPGRCHVQGSAADSCHAEDGGSLNCTSASQYPGTKTYIENCALATVTAAQPAVPAVTPELWSGSGLPSSTLTLKHGALAPDTSTYLLASLALPSTLGDDQNTADDSSDYATYGGKTASLTWTVTAVQRVASTK